MGMFVVVVVLRRSGNIVCVCVCVCVCVLKELPLADLFDGLGKEPPPGALCSLTPGVEQRLGEDQEEQRDDQ